MNLLRGLLDNFTALI